MSEKMLAILFHLYPPAFRECYLREALLLFRDRRLHETGVYRKSRLLCDLLVDFLVGLTIAWQSSYSATIVPSHQPTVQPTPTFRLLNPDPLRPASILLGSIFSVAAFSLFVSVLRTTAPYPIERRALPLIDSVLQRLNQPTLPAPQNVDL